MSHPSEVVVLVLMRAEIWSTAAIPSLGWTVGTRPARPGPSHLRGTKEKGRVHGELGCIM